MKSLLKRLIQQHHQCELLFCCFEDSVAEGNWSKANQYWHDFNQILTDRMNTEENSVFYPYEQQFKNNLPESPTKILRIEHRYLKHKMVKLEQLVKNKDSNKILEYSDNLMIDINQHFQREEIAYNALISETSLKK